MTPVVHIRRGRAKPLWHGHPWVFSDAIGGIDGAPQDGDLVHVIDHEGRPLGQGFFSARSSLRVRLIASHEERVDAALFTSRLETALATRNDVLGLPSHETTGYRLVHGEGDRLPGLVIDVYGDVVAVQLGAIGMKRRENDIYDALEALLSPRAIIEVAVADAQKHEGILSVTRVVRGALEGELVVKENGLSFGVDLLHGQKTGYYFDQRENRRVVAKMAKDKRVLDAYSYTGGFAIAAAKAGAESVVAIDSSERAAQACQENAKRNDVHVDVVHEDVARAFKMAKDAGDAFDLIILDPPKFAPRASVTGDALRAYRAVNAAGLELVNDGGLFVTASCSHHVGEAELQRALTEAAKDAKKSVQVIEVRGQAPDHPWLVACPESRYLTLFICVVQRA